MRIGVPREIKPFEGRVALIPAACAELVERGHQVCVEHDAGRLSGHPDEAYRDAGVEIAASAAELYAGAELVIKVKEPQSEDLAHLRADHILFCYLHLAADHALARQLRDIGLTAIGFETVQLGEALPLLTPMSEIAGRLAVQVGAHLLHQPLGGLGVMLGGLAASDRGRVVVLGAGVAGGAAASAAAALGANVTVFDIQRERLERMRALGANVTGLYPFGQDIARALPEADLLVGAVLAPGKRAPHLVSRAMVESMRPGSVIADISVDQGGCVETTRATTYADPVYTVAGVLHFTVANIPGAVPRTASGALSASLMPYARRLGEPDWHADPALSAGINVRAGRFENPVIQKELEDL